MVPMKDANVSIVCHKVKTWCGTRFYVSHLPYPGDSVPYLPPPIGQAVHISSDSALLELRIFLLQPMLISHMGNRISGRHTSLGHRPRDRQKIVFIHADKDMYFFLEPVISLDKRAVTKAFYICVLIGSGWCGCSGQTLPWTNQNTNIESLLSVVCGCIMYKYM